MENLNEISLQISAASSGDAERMVKLVAPTQQDTYLTNKDIPDTPRTPLTPIDPAFLINNNIDGPTSTPNTFQTLALNEDLDVVVGHLSPLFSPPAIPPRMEKPVLWTEAPSPGLYRRPLLTPASPTPIEASSSKTMLPTPSPMLPIPLVTSPSPESPTPCLPPRLRDRIRAIKRNPPPTRMTRSMTGAMEEKGKGRAMEEDVKDMESSRSGGKKTGMRAAKKTTTTKPTAEAGRGRKATAATPAAKSDATTRKAVVAAPSKTSSSKTAGKRKRAVDEPAIEEKPEASGSGSRSKKKRKVDLNARRSAPEASHSGSESRLRLDSATTAAEIAPPPPVVDAESSASPSLRTEQAPPPAHPSGRLLRCRGTDGKVARK